MEWEVAKDLLVSGIAGYMAMQLREMSLSITAIKINLAVMVEKQAKHEEELKSLKAKTFTCLAYRRQLQEEVS
jgi:hypothetical protein